MSPLVFGEPELDPEPLPDLGYCSGCGNWFEVSELKTGWEGDVESGYHEIDLCPECLDGGCVDNYSMTDERRDEWLAWAKRNLKSKLKDEA